MSKRTVSYLLLACLTGGVVFTIGFQATKSPSLRVGTTIRDPQQYFTQQLRHEGRFPLRVSTLVSQPKQRQYVYSTGFVLLGREITSRTFVYRFETNGTVLYIYTRRSWPIFHF